MHFFSLIKIPDSQIERADEAAQFGFDCGLIGHLLADAFGRSIQHLPQHGGIPAESHGWPHAFKHVLKKARDLGALGGFRRGLGFIRYCLDPSRVGIPAGGFFARKQPRHNAQTHDEKRENSSNAPEQELLSQDRLLKSV